MWWCVEGGGDGFIFSEVAAVGGWNGEYERLSLSGSGYNPAARGQGRCGCVSVAQCIQCLCEEFCDVKTVP